MDVLVYGCSGCCQSSLWSCLHQIQKTKGQVLDTFLKNKNKKSGQRLLCIFVLALLSFYKSCFIFIYCIWMCMWKSNSVVKAQGKLQSKRWGETDTSPLKYQDTYSMSSKIKFGLHLIIFWWCTYGAPLHLLSPSGHFDSWQNWYDYEAFLMWLGSSVLTAAPVGLLQTRWKQGSMCVGWVGGWGQLMWRTLGRSEFPSAT